MQRRKCVCWGLAGFQLKPCVEQSVVQYLQEPMIEWGFVAIFRPLSEFERSFGGELYRVLEVSSEDQLDYRRYGPTVPPLSSKGQQRVLQTSKAPCFENEMEGFSCQKETVREPPLHRFFLQNNPCPSLA